MSTDRAPAVHVGEIDMSGVNLVRHHLQQAQLCAEFLQGGSRASSIMAPIVEQACITQDEAAQGVRDSVRAALQVCEELQG